MRDERTEEIGTTETAALAFRSVRFYVLAIGALFAWWNLYHDDGFLFLGRYLNQVESCVSCYGGALIACAVIVCLKGSWQQRLRSWIVALVAIQALGGIGFFAAVAAQWPLGLILAQLLIGAAFFSQLFFLARWLSRRPLPSIALAIAAAVTIYGLMECGAWVITALCPLFAVRILVRFALLGLGFACSWHILVAHSPEEEGDEDPSASSAAAINSVAKGPARRLPWQLILHSGAYWLIFGMTHAMASGIIPLGHDKLIPCYLGSVIAGGVFYFVFAREGHIGKIWSQVRTTVFPLAMLSFLLLSLANTPLTFLSIGFAQCAMDLYFAFYLLASVVVMRKIRSSFLRTAATATLLAVPFITVGVLIGDALKVSVPLTAEFYGLLSIAAFVLLVAGTFWVGDDRRVELVWGLEKKLTPKRFEDKTTSERCAKAVEKFGLTKREGEILLFLAQGQNAAAIAESEVISLNTARTHISRIHRKMSVHNQQELLRCLKEI